MSSEASFSLAVLMNSVKRPITSLLVSAVIGNYLPRYGVILRLF